MLGLKGGLNSTRYMEGWDQYIGLQSLVGAPVADLDEKRIPRQKRRSMGRMSIFAAYAADEALLDAGITLENEDLWRVGCVIGSSMGSAKSINDAFETMLPDKDLSRLNSTMFFQCMSHTAAVNTAQYLGLVGTVMAPAAACASALHSIGTAYDMIRLGRQDVILCGGAEELHPTVTGSFDILFATSTKYNDSPGMTPRPFDRDRDGLVCGEGCGILILEEYDRAVKRGARIYGEVTAFSTTASGLHVSQSNRDSMVVCMQQALSEAAISAGDVDYINAHGTSTPQGDIAECQAIKKVFGEHAKKGLAVSSTKSMTGHLLGAAGGAEAVFSVLALETGTLPPTINVEEQDPECDLDVVPNVAREKRVDAVLSNSFGFGGTNAVICFTRV